MKFNISKSLGLLLAGLILLLSCGHSVAHPGGFLHAQGQELHINGQSVRLRAICFSNFYNKASLNLAESLHHSEVDFRRVKKLGFNAIRFAFNGNWYENDAEAFWRWLDQNIYWARKHQIQLILDLHVPIGGFWLAPNSSETNFSLWSDANVQQRNIDLWQAIASRYRNETIIAGYDLLNEPVTSDNSGWQWQQLANQLIKAIRQVDPNHLLIVGRLYGTNEQYAHYEKQQQFLVDDPNVLYDFHFYEPIEYTHQYASWLASPPGDGGKYPDGAQENRNPAYLEREFLKYYQFGIDNNVPVSVLETGLIRHTFDDPAKGGVSWARDILSLFEKYNTSFAWWQYHGDQMGLYLNNQQQSPLNLNQPLNDVFKAAHAKYIKALQQQNPAANRLPATSPPGGLTPAQVPQFVTLSFDDNTSGAGLDWALSLFRGYKNPDGSRASSSFYMNTYSITDKADEKAQQLIASIRRAVAEGHEIGNHTHNHQRDIDKSDWPQFEKTMANMNLLSWDQRIRQASDQLHLAAGITKDAITGFRAPYLKYNQATFSALSNQGFMYDTSVEEGYALQFDGTNLRWPYALDRGSPGHSETWSGNVYNPNQVVLDTTPGLWEFPIHTLMVPPDDAAKTYGIKPGLWQRMQKKSPNLRNHRVSGLDYNLFVLAGLSGKEVTAILSYNLDLRLKGNRAPMMFGAHSQYYVNQQWAEKNTPQLTLQEMRDAIADFVTYARSKPEVRLQAAHNVIEWCKKPIALKR
ncbi:MAG: cellulase family glycosylhydrolase [Thiolinea sp.]